MSDSQRPCCTVPERIFNGWLVEAHDHCTCEGKFGHHESSCGMVPLVHLRDLDGWDELEAEVTAGVVAEVKHLRETYGLDAEDQHPCVRVEAYVRMAAEKRAAEDALAAQPDLIPWYAMLDVWKALGHDSQEFEDWRDRVGYADAWAWLCSQVRCHYRADVRISSAFRLAGEITALSRQCRGCGRAGVGLMCAGLCGDCQHGEARAATDYSGEVERA